MLLIDLERNVVVGVARVGDIRRLGLLKASVVGGCDGVC
jgi:hypothetical protein